MNSFEIKEKNWTYNELWQGCILISIANAISAANYPELVHEHSWDGCNYSTHDSQGSRGTISFAENYYAAGVRSDEFIGNTFSAIDYYQKAPNKVRTLAQNETLQYLLDDVKEEVLPSITTAFWGDKGKAFSSHSMGEMLERGGELFEIQSSNTKIAFEICTEEFELTDDQSSLLKVLYQKKIENPNEMIYLSHADISSIDSINVEGIKESKSSFLEIGIKWV